MTSLHLYFCPCSYSPGCCWPSLLLGLAAGPCPARCPPGPPGPFPQSCSLGSLEPVLLQRVPSIQVKDFALVIAEFHNVPVSPFLQVPWDGSPALEHIKWWLNLMSLQT